MWRLLLLQLAIPLIVAVLAWFVGVPRLGKWLRKQREAPEKFSPFVIVLPGMLGSTIGVALFIAFYIPPFGPPLWLALLGGVSIGGIASWKCVDISLRPDANEKDQ